MGQEHHQVTSRRHLLRRSTLAGGAAALAGVTAAAFPRMAAASAPGDWFNAVADYGADSTGVNNAAGNINNAIDAAATAGGGVVYLPRGTYRIEYSIRLKSNVVLLGAGAGTVIKVAAGTTGSSAIKFLADSISAAACNLRIDGTDHSTSSVVGVLIEAPTAAATFRIAKDLYHLVADVEILRVSGHGVHISGSGPIAGGARGVRLRNVLVHDNGRPGSVAHGFLLDGSDGTFTDCVAATSGRLSPGTNNPLVLECAGFVIAGGNSQLHGCKAFYCADDGFRIQSSRASLVNCQAQDNGAAGFKFEGTSARHALLSGCLADSNKTAGFDLKEGRGNVIASAAAIYRAGGGPRFTTAPAQGVRIRSTVKNCHVTVTTALNQASFLNEGDASNTLVIVQD